MYTDRKVPNNSSISNTKISTKSLVLAAIFVAMNIILTRVGAIMLFGGSVRFSFGNIPIIMSGIILGPVVGAMAGGVGDLLGVFINSHGGGFHPGFTLSAVLTGLLPGLVVKFNSTNKFSLLNIIISNVTILIIVSICLNTYWLSQLQGSAYLALLPARVIVSIIITILNILITYPLVNSLEKTGII